MAEIDDPRVQPALEAMLTDDAGSLQQAIDEDPEIVSIRGGTTRCWSGSPSRLARRARRSRAS